MYPSNIYFYFQSALLLPMLQLWLLLLRRETNGWERTSHEEETPAGGIEGTAAGTTGTVLRAIGIAAQQFAFAGQAISAVRSRFPQHIRIENVNARTESTSTDSALLFHDGHIHCARCDCIVPAGGMAVSRWHLFLLYELIDDWIWWSSSWIEKRVDNNDMVLFDIHHVRYGIDSDVL